MPTTYTKRNLFGGAITVEAPNDLVDASDFRQVPDNQEVFMYKDCGASIIVEILQRVDTDDLEKALDHHYGALAHDNSASIANVISRRIIPNKPEPALWLEGIQHIQKFNLPEPDHVKILMGLYRVESKSIDLVVTFNLPIKAINEEDALTTAQAWEVTKDFDKFVNSLTIIDYGLFA